jgi:hypothetical protein
MVHLVPHNLAAPDRARGLSRLPAYRRARGAGCEREPLGHRGIHRLLQRLRCGGGHRPGFVLRNAQDLPAGAQEAVYEAVKDMPELSLIFGLSLATTFGA